MPVNINPWLFSQNNSPAIFGGPSYCDEYQAVYDSFTTPPSDAVAEAQNTMVSSLVDAGVWAEFDVFQFYAQESNGDSEALKNWVNPGTDDAALVNAPTFSSNNGFTGNGTNQYINSNFNPGDGGTYKFLQDDAFAAIYIKTNVAEGKYDFGSLGSTDQQLQSRSATGDNAYIKLNDNSAVTISGTVTDPRGLWILNRSAPIPSPGLRVYRAGTEIGTGTTTSAAPIDQDIFVMCLNNSGTPAFHCTKQIGLFAAGGALTPTQVTAFNSAVELFFFMSDSAFLSLSTNYRQYVDRTDISAGNENAMIDQQNTGADLYAKYLAQSFVSPIPMDSTINRKVFPTIYNLGGYMYLSYNAGNSHQVDALNPHVLDFVRSSDNWETSVNLQIKCIDGGGGVMREIDPDIDGYFPWNYQLAYASGKLYAIFPTFLLNETVDTYDDFTPHKTYICWSSDNGTTWSTLSEVDDGAYVSSSKPIVVGNEIWYASYKYAGDDFSAIKSYVLKWNYTTGQAGVTLQLDEDWTGLSTSEPVLLEYSSGYFMCVARVNHNANFVGDELIHKGSVIAYSTDGLDWSSYTFYDEGTAYPNQPRLFMYNSNVYLSRGYSVMHGPVASDKSEIEWVAMTTGQTPWYQNYIYTFRTIQRNGVTLDRYDPRTGNQTTLRELDFKGTVDFVAGVNDTFYCTGSYILDGGVYIGEPWVCTVKPNSVGSGPTFNERLLFMGEIPGDYNTSNAIKIYSFYAEVGDTVNCEWFALDGKPTTTLTGTINALSFIDFAAGAEVSQAKFVYEIIKA